jgi:hypothetical protein
VSFRCGSRVTGCSDDRRAPAPPERCRDDTGSEVVEIVLVLPVLMALLTLGLQLAMWGLAAHALSLGVAEGGATARAQTGDPQAAAATVGKDVHDIAGSLVGSLKIEVRALPDDFVAVSATGVVPTIFPGLDLHVSADSTGPVQVFRASG